MINMLVPLLIKSYPKVKILMNGMNFFDAFASLLNHPKSLVRNRVLYILSANAQWDDENRFDAIISDYLSHEYNHQGLPDRISLSAEYQRAYAN